MSVTSGSAVNEGVTKLRFAWPAERLQVTEYVLKKGAEVRLTYVLMVQRHEDELRILYSDFRFLEVAGRRADDPAIRSTVEDLERRLAGSSFGLRVDDTGRFIGVANIEEVIAATRAAEGSEAADATVRMLNDPSARAMFEAGVAKPWETWVGAWLDLELAPNTSIDVVSKSAVGDQEVSQKLRYEHLGAAAGHPGFVRLRATSTMDGPDFAAALAGVLQALVPEGGGQAVADGIDGITGRRDTTYEVVLDPATMRPAWASSVETTTVEGNGERRQLVERHEWTFVVASP